MASHMIEDPIFYQVIFETINPTVLSTLKHILYNMENVVCVIEDRKSKIYLLESISTDMHIILEGQPFSEFTYQDILAIYRTSGRLLLFAKRLEETVLVKNEYRSQYALKLIEKCAKPEQYGNGRILRVNKNSATDVHVVKNKNTHTKYLLQRPKHDTTPELPQALDSYDGSSHFDSSLDTLNYDVYPADQIAFTTPLRRPTEDEKYPVQVSDSMDCGGSSMVPSLIQQPKYPPNVCIVTNVRSGPYGRSEYTDNGNSQSLQNVCSQSSSTATNVPGAVGPQELIRDAQTKPPRHPDFVPDHRRLETFVDHNWDGTTKPAPSVLAEYGLYATGRGDLVRCFQCGLGLKDWIKDDDPLTEHIKYSPKCEFLIEKIGSERLFHFMNALSSTGSSTGNPNERTGAAQNTSQPGLIRHARYQTVAERQQSFAYFPRHVTQTPRELALAGFFFTGEGDICRCFTCDGGLKSWAPGDDPFEEHAKYFPQCTYLRQLKGEAYIQMVQHRLHDRNGMASNATPSPQVSQRPERPLGPAVNIAPMLEQLTIRAERAQNLPSRTTGTEVNLQSPAATSVLEMGYSKEVVTMAIKKLRSKGNTDPSAQSIMELILDYEEISDVTPRGEHVPNEGQSNNKNESMQLMTENEMLKSSMLCVICKEEERNILCLPCAHHRMCANCSSTITHCPSCGKYIQEKIRTYMA